MEYIKNFDSTIEQKMNPFKKTFYLKGILHLILVLYAAKLAPELPREVLSLFANQYFKLFIFSLILWTAQFSPSTAILISLAFMVSMNALNKKKLWEFLENDSENFNITNPVDFLDNISEGEREREYLDNVSEGEGEREREYLDNVSEGEREREYLDNVSEGEDERREQLDNVSPVKIPITPTQSVEATKVLAQAAASPEKTPPAVVSNIANIAAANVTTTEGANALKQLAQQAIVPAAGVPAKVEEAVKQVVASIPPATPAPAPAATIAQKVAVSEPAPAPSGAGCYPVRRYDISKVKSSQWSDKSSNPVFEDYQTWTPSK